MVIIALNYGGINEVVRACNRIDGKITEDEVDEIITEVNNIVNKDEKEKKDD